MRKTLVVVSLVVATLCITVGVLLWQGSSAPDKAEQEPATTQEPVRLVRQGRAAFRGRRYEQALSYAQDAIAAAGPEATNPKSALADAYMLAGESAGKLQAYPEAVAFYERVPEGHPDASVARWAAAEIQAFQGNLTEASDLLASSLRLDPAFAPAHHRWIELCNFTGRRRETGPSLEQLFRIDDIRPEYLFFAGNLEKETCSADQLQQVLRKQPNDLLPNLGLARIAIGNADYETAIDLLDALLTQSPTLVEAHAQLGHALLEAAPERLPEWHSALPQAAEAHPTVWYVRGLWIRDSDLEQAARCFGTAIYLDGNHVAAHQALSSLLQKLERIELARQFGEKANQLQTLNATLELLYIDRSYTTNMKKAAELAVSLGRYWEAAGWCQLAMDTDPQLTWPASLRRQFAVEFQKPAVQLTAPESNLVSKSWLQQYPEPEFARIEVARVPARDAQPAGSAAVAKIQLVDVAADVGLTFKFDNNSADLHEGRRMHETSGGGVGVLDYDRDGLPDVFCSQGGSFSDQSQVAGPQSTDRLFGNRSAQGEPQFHDFTAQAFIEDGAFGQGVAIGDVNADGFDDIYVCNIGQNALWLNAGDGTFVNGESLIPADDAWTSSAAILDLNLDGLVEIYDANYVTGDNVFTQMCDIGGKPRSCSPLLFEPAPDRLLSAADDGTFRGLAQPTMVSNSFGVVGFRKQGSVHPSLFVAGDQMTNLLGVFATNGTDGDAGQSFTLDNQALVSGVAFDQSGQAQACMGIAAGNADEDGDVDFYVTNFYLEYNTLYLQQDGYFEDATPQSNTVAATKPWLAFGTQFVDLQRDGHEDLVVLNGHIDDHSHVGIPEDMPPQVFLGSGSGSFRLRPQPEAGYMARTHVGRALAKIDFNLDGLEDLLCGHLNEPLALLENRSQPVGKSLAIELVGTKSDRNAFCAIVTVRGDDYQSTKQLTAGSGYQATNERMLHFAIPEELGEVSVDVEWPNGQVESFQIPTQPAWLIVEGQDAHPR